MIRRKTRTVNIGGIPMGGGHRILVQSMTNTDTRDPQATLAQIRRLANAGCELVRIAVPDQQAAGVLREIKENSPIPLAADIHFDHKLALAALEAGFDKLRINPGTMASKSAVAEVVAAAKIRQVPIRIGVNSGSVHKDFKTLPRPQALVKSALYYCEMLEDMDFHDIVVSLKSSSVLETIQANIEFAHMTDFPLHLGVTEAGSLQSSVIKSSIGIGALLAQGIGNTLRVSVTGPPESEVPVALGILKALGLRGGVEIISCPTCGRCDFDLASAVQAVEDRVSDLDLDLKVAVMGCPVNGPGEAKHADMGIAFGNKSGVLFKDGKVIEQLANEELPQALLALIEASRG